MLCVLFYINLIYINLIYIIKLVTKFVCTILYQFNLNQSIYIIKLVTKLYTAISLIPNLVCLLRQTGLPFEPNWFAFRAELVCL